MRSSTDEKPLKSSLELAMERLAKKDADAGVASKPVTDAQKAAIKPRFGISMKRRDVRELEVLHQSKVNATSSILLGARSWLSNTTAK